MKEININVVLKNNTEISEESFKAIKDTDKIIYNEKDYKVTIYLKKPLKLIREDKDCVIEMNFLEDEQTKGRCYVKQEKSAIELDILTDYVIIEDSVIIVKYKVLTTNQEVVYKVEVQND